MTETYTDSGIVRIRIRTARCDGCGCRFEYIPYHVHSTKGMRGISVGGIPRCPKCWSYQKTVTCEETR